MASTSVRNIRDQRDVIVVGTPAAGCTLVANGTGGYEVRNLTAAEISGSAAAAINNDLNTLVKRGGSGQFFATTIKGQFNGVTDASLTLEGGLGESGEGAAIRVVGGSAVGEGTLLGGPVEILAGAGLNQTAPMTNGHAAITVYPATGGDDGGSPFTTGGDILMTPGAGAGSGSNGNVVISRGNLSLTAGNITASGTVTATSYVGSGMSLTGGGGTFSSTLVAPVFTSSTTNVAFTLGNRNYSTTTPSLSICTGIYSASTAITNVVVAITPTYFQTGTAGSTDLRIVRTETALGSGNHRFLDFYAGTLGTTNVLYIQNNGLINTANQIYAGSNITTATGYLIASLVYISGKTTTTLLGSGGDWLNVGDTSGSNNIGVRARNLYLQNTTATVNTTKAKAIFEIGVADEIGLIIKGFTSQTGNLTEWQNVSGNILRAVTSAASESLASGVEINWSTSATDATTTKDTGVRRVGAGRVLATNGASGVGFYSAAGFTVTDLSVTKVDINYSFTGITIRSGDQFKISSNATNVGAGDVGFGRGGVGEAVITNGSTGRGNLYCNFLKTDQVAVGATASGLAKGYVGIKNASGNSIWIPYWDNGDMIF